MLVFILAFTLCGTVKAQDFKDLDTSPHDIVYFRTNKISPPNIKVLYGRPKKNGREIFGEVIPYGKIWKVGANEATEVVFYQDVVFGDTERQSGYLRALRHPAKKGMGFNIKLKHRRLGSF